MVLLRIPAACATPTVSRAPIRTFRGNTNRTRSSRSSPGAWRRAGSWCRAFHDEFWSNPETPSATKPRAATQRLDASVPAINFGHLMHTASPNTVWDVRVGQFQLHAGHVADVGRSDDSKPHRSARKCLERRPPADRQGAAGSHDGQGDTSPTIGPGCSVQITNGEWARKSTVASIVRSPSFRPARALSTPTDVLSQRTLQAAGQFGRPVRHRRRVRERRPPTGSRVTITPGLRFDHSRAISQDVPEFDAVGA